MLSGRTAFVTGGTGAVGAAIVRCLASHGASVAFSFYEDQDKADQLERELAGQGKRARAYALDVLNGAAAAALAESVGQEFGPVDILVNNAGITQVMPFALIEEEDWDRLMDVNVKGMFLVTKAFVRPMIRHQRGAIVNLGSLAGMRVLEVPVHYATAKSAVVGFTLSLARELSRYSVRVNAVVPGLLTDGVSSNVPDKQRDDYLQHCTVGRAGKPEEVAELVAFLASERASYINAQAIHIDGGHLMKFRLVDKIIAWSPYQRITGLKAVSFEEYCLKEAFGEEARLPETLLLESFLQLGNWLLLLSSDFNQMGMVLRISEVRFHATLSPGQQLRMDVTVARQHEDGFELSGEGCANGRKIISGLGCLAVPVPAATYVNPEDLRVLFSEIYEPPTA